MADIFMVNGKKCIEIGAFVHINTKYHKPYLAVIDDQGEMVWQERQYLGYGKNRETLYCIENVKVGDLIKMAGGSGTNKYPFCGFVTINDGKTFEVKEIDYQMLGNIIAERKNSKEKKTNIFSSLDKKVFAVVKLDSLKQEYGEDAATLIINFCSVLNARMYYVDSQYLSEKLALAQGNMSGYSNARDASYAIITENIDYIIIEREP